MTVYEAYTAEFDAAFKRLADKLLEEMKSMKPNCSCGKSEVIENTAMGKSFFYCRGCKSEVTAQLSEIQSQIDKLQQEIVQAQQSTAVPRLWVGPSTHGNGQPMIHGGGNGTATIGGQSTVPNYSPGPPHQWVQLGGLLGGSQCSNCGDFSGSLSATRYCPGPAHPQSCNHSCTKVRPSLVGGNDVVCVTCKLEWWTP